MALPTASIETSSPCFWFSLNPAWFSLYPSPKAVQFYLCHSERSVITSLASDHASRGTCLSRFWNSSFSHQKGLDHFHLRETGACPERSRRVSFVVYEFKRTSFES